MDKILNKMSALVRPLLFPLVGSILVAAIIFLRTNNIKNPFVLPDEAAYLNLIFRIATSFTFDAAQYPPFYPFLASFFYSSKNILGSYDHIRLFNVCVFSLSFFPIFFTAKRFLALNRWELFVFCLSMLILPWSSLVTPIWAEPLYFLVFNIGIFLSGVSFFSQNSKYYFLTGICFGIIFLTKQGGLILGIGFF